MSKREITYELVREFLDYDPDTGLFTWKFRDWKWYDSDKGWSISNAKCAGKPAFPTLNNTGYWRSKILGVPLLAHRVAFLWMVGRWPTEIDHINRIKTDNRFCNLREVTRAQNRMNADRPLTKTS